MHISLRVCIVFFVHHSSPLLFCFFLLSIQTSYVVILLFILSCFGILLLGLYVFFYNGCFIWQAEPINANCYQEIVQLRSQFDCVEWSKLLNMWWIPKCLNVWWSHTFEKGAFCLFSKSNHFWLLTDLLISFRKKVQYFHRASGRFLYEEFDWNLQKPDLRTWITAFAYFFLMGLPFLSSIYWLVCLFCVCETCCCSYTFTYEWMLTAYTHHIIPEARRRRGLPFEGICGQSGHEWIYLLIVITPYISCIL